MSNDFMDGWLTEGGLDDQPVTFRNAKFIANIERLDDQGNPQVQLSVDIVPDDPDLSTFEEQLLGIGKGWEPSDDGAKVERVDGKKPQFNKASKGGRLVDSLLALPAFRKAVQERHAAGDKVTPFDASFYEGMKGQIKQNHSSFKSAEGEDVEFRFFTLTEFHGYESSSNGKAASGAAKPAKKAAAKKAAAKKAAAKPVEEAEETPAEPAEPETATGGDLEALRATLTEACQNTSADTHDEWMIEMYETYADELTTDEAMALVDDPAAIWATIWS